MEAAEAKNSVADSAVAKTTDVAGVAKVRTGGTQATDSDAVYVESSDAAMYTAVGAAIASVVDAAEAEKPVEDPSISEDSDAAKTTRLSTGAADMFWTNAAYVAASDAAVHDPTSAAVVAVAGDMYLASDVASPASTGASTVVDAVDAK